MSKNIQNRSEIDSKLREVMEDIIDDDASGSLLKRIIDTDSALEMSILESYITDVVWVLSNSTNEGELIKTKKILLSIDVENDIDQAEYLLGAARDGYIIEVAGGDYKVDSFCFADSICHMDLQEVRYSE